MVKWTTTFKHKEDQVNNTWTNKQSLPTGRTTVVVESNRGSVVLVWSQKRKRERKAARQGAGILVS
eukprot:6240253-Pyramimonas_sp.AAC.1